MPETDWSIEGDSTIPEETVRLGELVAAGVGEFTYIYDFGDDWRHTVQLGEIAPSQAGVFCPRCISGEHAAVPEDCGGLPGFEEFVAVMTDAEHPDHAEMARWYGGEYDPDDFDVAEINRVLEAVTTGVFPEDLT